MLPIAPPHPYLGGRPQHSILHPFRPPSYITHFARNGIWGGCNQQSKYGHGGGRWHGGASPFDPYRRSRTDWGRGKTMIILWCNPFTCFISLLMPVQNSSFTILMRCSIKRLSNICSKGDYSTTTNKYQLLFTTSPITNIIFHHRYRSYTSMIVDLEKASSNGTSRLTTDRFFS